MSLMFVPRSVAKRKDTAEATSSQVQGSGPLASSSARRPSIVSGIETEPPTSLRLEKKEEKSHGEELAILLECALSNYALWLQPDLQRYAASAATEGYLSLERALTESYLVQQSYFAPEPPISSFPQSLKEHGSGSLQLRVRLVTESRARSAQADVGGFDVRRTDWATLRNMEDPTRVGGTIWSRQDEDWEKQTLYVENVPSTVKTIPQILHYINALCCLDHATDRNERETARSTRFVDYVYLPSRYGATSDERPFFKGFAFVVFAARVNAEAFAEKWPWVVKGVDNPLLCENQNAIASAHRSRFRSLSMEQWNRMKHLYIEKQQSMLLRKTALTEGGPDRSGGQTKLSDVVVTPAAIAPALHYPVGCLVFVKNLSPGTNKAVLRSLLASAFSADSSGYIDYVDYTRGLASCHVRLSSPDHAKLLVDYFTANRVVQVDGQDATGREGEAQGWIVAQVVTGRLEEMYWDKVPERIRVDVMRRIQQQDAPPAEQGTHDGPSDNKRKRRKKLS